MSDAQIRWHILNEIRNIVVQRIKHRDILVKKLDRCDSLPLFTLFMSGKGPAEAVRNLTSHHVKLEKGGNGSEQMMQVMIDGTAYHIELRWFQKIALQWTRFLDYRDSFHYDEDTVMPEYITTLRDFNRIETLRVRKPEFSLANMLFNEYALISACPNVASLIVDPVTLAQLIDDTNVDLTKIRSLELKKLWEGDHEEDTWGMEDLDHVMFNFEYLAQHPKRCPVLETLTITTRVLVLTKVFESMSQNAQSISTVKTLNLVVAGMFCKFAYFHFRYMEFIPSVMPNVENVCVTFFNKMYKRRKIVKLLKEFEKCKFGFEFNLFVHRFEEFGFRSITQMERFHKKFQPELSAYGVIVSIDKDERFWEYLITKSYPDRTMTMRVKVHNDDDFDFDKYPYFTDSEATDLLADDSEDSMRWSDDDF